MSRKWLAAALGALMIGAFAAMPLTASADESCNSGHVCVWTKNTYQGVKGESLCTGGPHPLAGQKFSAKNRCANKAAWLRNDGIAGACVNPGNNIDLVFSFDELWIGAEGSRC